MFVSLWGRDVTCWHWCLSQLCADSVAACSGNCCTTASPLTVWWLLCFEHRYFISDPAAFWVAGALCSVWLVSGQLSDSRVELSQGMLLMQLPECKVFRDLSWPQALRSCLCPLKGSSCGCMLGQGELRQTYVIQIVTLRPVFISTYRTTFSLNRSVEVRDTWIQNDCV